MMAGKIWGKRQPHQDKWIRLDGEKDFVKCVGIGEAVENDADCQD